MNKYVKMIGIYLVILLIIILAVTFFNPMQSQTETLIYSELLAELEADNITDMELNENNVSGTMKNGDEFEAVVPQYVFQDQIQPYISENGIEVTIVESQDSWWISLLPSLILIVLMVVFFLMFTQQSSGGGGKVMSFGKSRAKMHSETDKKVTFKDVAGADEEKEELEEIVEFLRSPARYTQLGARIPQGVLLIGPPGTGKTLLARAVAGEAGVPFFSISGSDFVEMFVGVGASRVRDLFENAKKNSPCIVFIDEIDAVGRQRGAGLGGGHDEREQTLNQLLVEMDGFGVNEGIIIIAATNRPDILDPALLRPGRFDRQVMVGLPDVKGREEILKVHKKDKPLAEDIELKVIAKGTPGFTGADLENLMNEAALLAARNKQDTITMVELEEAIKRTIAGPEKRSKVITEEDKVITAYHESGHAIIMKILPGCDSVHEISIIPRGMAAGYTIALPDDDNSHMPKQKLLDQISGLLGGRAAEKIALDDICTGASNDIERVTTIARKMVMEFGMSDYLGPMTFGSSNSEVFLGRDLGRSRDFSEEVAAAIDKEVRSIVERAFERSCKILEEHREILDATAKTLLEKETINGEEFEKLFNKIEGIEEAEIVEEATEESPEEKTETTEE